MKILAYQPRIEQVRTAHDRRAHVGRMLQFLEAKCRQEPDIGLIILPELCTVEYSVPSFQTLVELAEPLAGETFTAVAAFAKKWECAVCYGFPRVVDGEYRISQLVVGASGQLIADYDKLHLANFGASMEPEYFNRGGKLAVFELNGLRFGIIICYDFRFSDLIKQLVEAHQVDVILHPVAFTKDATFASWHPFVICRALEHQVYFLSVNRAGEAWGNSILCPPWIDDDKKPLLFGEDEAAAVFQIDPAAIAAARAIYPFRADRLADYSILP